MLGVKVAEGVKLAVAEGGPAVTVITLSVVVCDGVICSLVMGFSASEVLPLKSKPVPSANKPRTNKTNTLV